MTTSVGLAGRAAAARARRLGAFPGLTPVVNTHLFISDFRLFLIVDYFIIGPPLRAHSPKNLPA